jgi:Late exocytosis, associated with Golgi transport
LSSLPDQLATMGVDLAPAMSSISQSRRLDWLLPAWLEDAAAYDQSMDENMVTIGYTVAINTIILFFCVIAFSFYRMYDDHIFAPKVAMMPDRTPARLSNSTLFAWIKELWDIDDDVIIAKSGYDILFFIRFYRLAFKIFAWFGIYAWGVLLPVNA